MLSVIDLHTYYGDSHVLQGVNLQVERGTVATVVGRNGVGKTTLCRSIAGFTPATAGRIVFESVDLTALPPHEIWTAGVGPCRRDVAFSIHSRCTSISPSRRGRPLVRAAGT